jgi:2-C-methyl-D-erythritol 4-phosphate cytidylyltransferase
MGSYGRRIPDGVQENARLTESTAPQIERQTLVLPALLLKNRKRWRFPKFSLHPWPGSLYSSFMVSAIIVAAGSGTRMGPEVDKLFLRLKGRPVIVHTWSTFEQASCIDEIVLVVRDGLQADFLELQEMYELKKACRLVAGGKERQDSVWNGLESVSPACEIVAIQDGARPCTPPELIAATVDNARRYGAAVAAQPATDTIKESLDGRTVSRTLDRSKLWTVQTPQTFVIEVIRKALAEVRRRKLHLTDDTAACELIGQPVALVPSNLPNPKITRPEDVPLVEALLGRGRT